MTILTDDQQQKRLDAAMAYNRSVPPEKLIANLHKLFDLKVETKGTPAQDGVNEYSYASEPAAPSARLFGGQVIAQAMIAADKTVEDTKAIHSLHAYFLRVGDEALPLHFRVHRDFDGRNISNRRVVVRQADKVIFNLTASFQKPSEGLSHQSPMPDILPPEKCKTVIENLARNPDMSDEAVKIMSRPRPFEMRGVRPFGGERSTSQYQWFKTVGSLPDDPLFHRAALAYASDMALLSTCMLPHGVSWATPDLFSASLDHAMWFHNDFRVDDWFAYVMKSDWSGGMRGLNRGALYGQDGTLIASTMQEGLIRYNPPKQEG